MREKRNVKEHIIEVTTELIEQYNGDTKNVTARMIAERAGVALGLINYHFGSKENLITVCVQRIVNNVVFSFSPGKKDYDEEDNLSDQNRLTDWAGQVFEFLFENRAISRISILGDLENYHPKTNSVYTQKGFSLAIRNNSSESEKKLIAFILTSAMQTAFLGSDFTKEILGYDFNLKKDRKAFIEETVSLFFSESNNSMEVQHEK